jgi:hypothetical protein
LELGRLTLLLFFIEMLRMTESDLYPEREALYTPQEFQTTLEAILRNQVAPYYSRPLPRTPLASRSASYLRMSRPEPSGELPYYGKEFSENESAYCAAITEGSAPSRSLHGLGHMYRSVIWNQMIQNILRQTRGIIQSPKDHLLTILAAAFHDSARQSEGTDFWDSASATQFLAFLEHHFIPTSMEDIRLHEAKKRAFFESIAKKNDVETESSLDPLKIAVHDPDCIEYLRIFGAARFQPNRLGLSKVIDSDDLKALIAECDLFIQSTSNTSFLTYIEYESERPYFEFMQKLKTGPYPIIQKYLTEELSTFS